MTVPTSVEAESLIAAGAPVVVRDAEWLVTQVQNTPSDGLMVRCLGTSGLVKDTEATFFTTLDHVEPLQPEETTLVTDESPRFRASRLYLEASTRPWPTPSTTPTRPSIVGGMRTTPGAARRPGLALRLSR
jgi:hypothetical protein